jgi:hypothetical protein
MKNDRRKFVVAGLAGLGMAAASVPAFAQLGGLLSGRGGGGGDIDSQVKGFLDRSVRIETTVSRALLAITTAYQTDEVRAEKQALFDRVGTTTDPKEHGAVAGDIYKSEAATLSELAQSKDLAEKTKNLTAEKQQQVAKGVVNILLGVLQARDLIPSGQNIMQGLASNPLAAPKVVPVKDALPRLGNSVSLVGKTIPAFVKALQGANIQVPSVTASTKQEDISELH